MVKMVRAVSNSESTPGFTTVLMLTSMMAAAVVLVPKKNKELEE